MSFHHAPVCKGAAIVLGALTLAVSIFDLKHYTHLQVSPHLTRDHQYWRTLLQPLTYASSSELFVAELVLYHVGIQIERLFGSYRFASFLAVSTLMSSLVSLCAVVGIRAVGGTLNRIPAGPSAVILSIVYQYSRVVPASYTFRIFSVQLSNKAFQYFLASQLAFVQWPESCLPAAVGLFVGQLYRADVVGLKSYRLPPRLYNAAAQLFTPFIGAIRPPRRSVLALPSESGATPNEPEVVMTQPSTTAANTPSVVSQWVNELRGSASTNLRQPSDAEIVQLSSMFPSAPRQQVVNALQQSPNVERAVEVLLSRQS